MKFVSINLRRRLLEFSDGELKEVRKEVCAIQEEVVLERAKSSGQSMCRQKQLEQRLIGMGIGRIDVIEEPSEVSAKKARALREDDLLRMLKHRRNISNLFANIHTSTFADDVEVFPCQ